MDRRKVRDGDDALELLRALSHSELSRKEFCRLHGIDGRSLRCWELNLGRRRGQVASEAPALRLLEVTVARPRSSASYRVHVGDLVVEVDDDFVDDTLVRLVAVLAAC
ncbi:MAG: hypothetical protein KC621_24945 [Myxococcales bacterium]|nr:hypothetical protein [Myxococcales bacterium]